MTPTEEERQRQMYRRRWQERSDAAGRLVPHPAPVVPCRLASTEETGRDALRLQRAAQGAGWRVQTTYARGYGLHATRGTPTGLRDSIAVRCWAPDRRRLVACWERPVKSWAFTFAIMWGPDLPLRLIRSAGDLRSALD